MDGQPQQARQAEGGPETRWVSRYATRHRLVRVKEFPGRIQPPKRVRIYARQDHHVLQFWDPAAKKTLYDRVNGDLIDAIARARDLDQKLENFKASGHGRGRVTHQELVDGYLADLHRRADAGEVSAATPRRFSSGLGHYLAYTRQPAVTVGYPAISKADRAFAMGFAAYLQGLQVSPNGHKNTQHRRMTGQRFVLNVVRGMYEWATDPERGNCVPAGFISPFRSKSLQPKVAATPMLGEPDVTVPMAASFLQACDPYQFRLFVPMILLGLRAAEPLLLFHEKLTGEWLDVVCIPELDYRTKGVRDKRLPLVAGLADHLRAGGGRGLLFVRRSVAEGRERAPLANASFDMLVEEHRRRCAKADATSASERASIRQRLLADAGAMTYKMIQGEFTKVASQLGWPRQATLKDFRHLFATSMANGGVPEHERQYLMGQSPGKAVILQYTHVNRLREHYLDALRREMGPVLELLDRPQATADSSCAA